MLTSQNQEAQSSANGRLEITPLRFNTIEQRIVVIAGTVLHPNKLLSLGEDRKSLLPVNLDNNCLDRMLKSYSTISPLLQSGLTFSSHPRHIDKGSANIHINSADSSFFESTEGVDKLYKTFIYTNKGKLVRPIEVLKGNIVSVSSIMIVLNNSLIDLSAPAPGGLELSPEQFIIDFCITRALTELLVLASGNFQPFSESDSILSSKFDRIIESLSEEGDLRSKILENISKFDSNLSKIDFDAIGIDSKLGGAKYEGIKALEARYKKIVEEKYHMGYSEPSVQDVINSLFASITDVDIEIKGGISDGVVGRAHMNVSMNDGYTVKLAGSGLSSFHFVDQIPFTQRRVEIQSREKNGRGDFEDLPDLPVLQPLATLKLEVNPNDKDVRVIEVNAYQQGNTRVKFTDKIVDNVSLKVVYPGCQPHTYKNIKFTDLQFNGLDAYLENRTIGSASLPLLTTENIFRHSSQANQGLFDTMIFNEEDLSEAGDEDIYDDASTDIDGFEQREELDQDLTLGPLNIYGPTPTFSTSSGLVRSFLKVGNVIVEYIGSLLDMKDLSGIEHAYVNIDFINPINTNLMGEQAEVADVA